MDEGNQRVIFRSAGTEEIGAAKRIAAKIIESFWIDSGHAADRLRLGNDHAKIGEIIARYQQKATEQFAPRR